MSKIREYLGTIIALATVAGLLAGGMAYFAKASELKEVKEEVVLTQLRLDQKIVSDQAFDVQKQVWALEERNRTYPDCREWPDDRDREQYRKLKVQLDDLNKKQDQLIRKK